MTTVGMTTTGSGVARTRRAVMGAIAALASTAAVATAALAAPAAAAPAERVVVIVPGQQLYAGNAQNEETFRPLAEAIRADGNTVVLSLIHI